jgi:hypothetical protein
MGIPGSDLSHCNYLENTLKYPAAASLGSKPVFLVLFRVFFPQNSMPAAAGRLRLVSFFHGILFAIVNVRHSFR